MSAEQIAVRLSATMQALLHDLPEDGEEAARFWNVDKRLRTWRALLKRRLSGPGGNISKLGLEVRAILKEPNQ